MNLPIASELSQIVKVAYSSILATVGLSVLFALAVASFARASDMRRAGEADPPAPTGWLPFRLVLCLAALVYGVILVGQKS